MAANQGVFLPQALHRNVLCVLMLAHFCGALTINRASVPHTAKPGYLVSSLGYWGQTFKVDTSHKGDIARHFSVLTNGDVITNSDITGLLGLKVDLVVTNELATESWTDTVSLEIRDGNTMLLFPHQYYEGHVLENQPPHRRVQGLENLHAKIANDPDRVVHYKLTGENHKIFKLKRKQRNGIEHLRVVCKESLDREEKHKYVLTIKAFTDSSEDSPAFAQILVHVDDENDNAPQFEKSHYHTTISDQTPTLTTVLKLKATDPDNTALKYVSNSVSSLFTVDGSNGEILLKSRKLLEPQSYELKVYAEDEDGKTSEPATVHIEVESKDDEDQKNNLVYQPVEPFADGMPVFEDNIHHHHTRYKRETRSVKEFEVPESMVGELIRLSENMNERFMFKEPAPKNLDINRFTGAVRLRDGHRLNFEDKDEIEFIALVTRDDNPGSRKYRFTS